MISSIGHDVLILHTCEDGEDLQQSAQYSRRPVAFVARGMCLNTGFIPAATVKDIIMFGTRLRIAHCATYEGNATKTMLFRYNPPW